LGTGDWEEEVGRWGDRAVGGVVDINLEFPPFPHLLCSPASKKNLKFYDNFRQVLILSEIWEC